jgi:Fis family transcriptional regulator
VGSALELTHSKRKVVDEMHECKQRDPQDAIEVLREVLAPLMATLSHSDDRKLYDLLMSSLEHALVEYALQVERSQSAAASLLGISRNTLRRKIEKYDLDVRKMSRSRQGVG